MRNEEMTRGKKLAMLFFLAVAAAFMLSFARPQAAQAKTYKLKLNKTKMTMVAGDKKKLKVRMKNGKWTSSRRRIKWSISYTGIDPAMSNGKVAITSDGKVIALKPGTATVKAKVGKKTLKCKVKVKGTGVTFTVNPTFDLNAVNKDWVREYSEIDDEDDACMSKIDGFAYNEDDCYWEYKDSTVKTNNNLDPNPSSKIKTWVKAEYEKGKDQTTLASGFIGGTLKTGKKYRVRWKNLTLDGSGKK